MSEGGIGPPLGGWNETSEGRDFGGGGRGWPEEEEAMVGGEVTSVDADVGGGRWSE